MLFRYLYLFVCVESCLTVYLFVCLESCITLCCSDRCLFVCIDLYFIVCLYVCPQSRLTLYYWNSYLSVCLSGTYWCLNFFLLKCLSVCTFTLTFPYIVPILLCLSACLSVCPHSLVFLYIVQSHIYSQKYVYAHVCYFRFPAQKTHIITSCFGIRRTYFFLKFHFITLFMAAFSQALVLLVNISKI